MQTFWTIFVLTSGHTWRATIAQWIRLAFHPATPGSTLLHTIYAFIICSQSLSLHCEKNTNQKRPGLAHSQKLNEY